MGRRRRATTPGPQGPLRQCFLDFLPLGSSGLVSPSPQAPLGRRCIFLACMPSFWKLARGLEDVGEGRMVSGTGSLQEASPDAGKSPWRWPRTLNSWDALGNVSRAPVPAPTPPSPPRGHAACCGPPSLLCGPRGLSPPPPRPAFLFLELGSQTHCPGGQPIPLKTSLQCLQESDVLGKTVQEAKASARSGFSQMGSSAFPWGEDLVFRGKEESVWFKKRQKRGCTFRTLHWKRP